MSEENPLLLSVPQAAETLGLSRDYTYRLVQDGVLPAVRFGRAIRVPRRALEEFIEQAQSENALAGHG